MDSQSPESLKPTLVPEELGLKDLSEVELYQRLMETGKDWTPEQRADVAYAYHLARKAHEGQRHRNKPYIYHILRNANRLTGYLHITDPAVVVGMILHDAPEDGPSSLAQAGRLPLGLDRTTLDDKYIMQPLAFDRLSELFSPRSVGMVHGLTNELPDRTRPKPSYEEWLAEYVEHVQVETENFDVFVGKLADWADNGMGIIHGDSHEPEREAHFQHKYGAVQPVLESRFKQFRECFDPQAQVNIEHLFALGRERLEVVA
jgi:hypothetical protein